VVGVRLGERSDLGVVADRAAVRAPGGLFERRPGEQSHQAGVGHREVEHAAGEAGQVVRRERQVLAEAFTW
jgi:hypothetical protein